MNRLSTVVLVIILLLLVVATGGCSMMRDSAIGVSNEEYKNYLATQTVARNYLQIWPIQSGFIHGALDHRQGEFPEYVIEAMNELDALAAKLGNTDPNSIADYDLGLSLGLRVRLLGAVVEEALRMYAPDILGVLPLMF